jgi:pantothenate kinase
MDGFHFYRAKLDTFEDPVMAHRRRGAHWTFDAVKFVDSLRATKAAGSGSFPSFDHARGDPIEDDIRVNAADHDVVIVEGLYLLLPISPWNEIKALMDLNVFLSCPEDLLVQRLTQRHMSAMRLDESSARLRALDNDIPNSVEVIASGAGADTIVNSY